MLHWSRARNAAVDLSAPPQDSHVLAGAPSPRENAGSTPSRDNLPGQDHERHLQEPTMDDIPPTPSRYPYQQPQSLPLPQSFYQRYFTKPDDSHRKKENDTDSRRFSFLAIGSLASALLAMLVLGGIIATAVALSVAEHHRVRAVGQGPDSHEAPIRLAIASNFPDPGLWYDNGTYYAFASTNAAGVLRYPGNTPSNASKYIVDFGLANVQMATSPNFIDWTLAPLNSQPLPAEGEWTQVRDAVKVDDPRISSTWAPAIIRRADGKFVMYYSAAPGFKVRYELTHPHPHCLGAAVSTGDSPAGPYEPLVDSIACPWEQGGAIDPEAFRDPTSGKLYLVYKIDGNNIGLGGACGNTFFPIRKTPIMLQEMNEDGVSKIGEPVEILTNGPQDGPLIEAPGLVQSKEGIYFLFFSSGCTRLPSYALQYATATNIKGPYTRAKKKLLKTGHWGLEAPGSVGISEDGKGGWSMAFHARVNDGEVGRVRAMFTTKIKFEGTKVSMMRDNATITLRHHHASDE